MSKLVFLSLVVATQAVLGLGYLYLAARVVKYAWGL